MRRFWKQKQIVNMRVIVLGLVLWSCGLLAQQNKEQCYCEKTHMIYTYVNGVKVDSIDFKKKLNELKNKSNSERSTEIDYYFYIMNNKPCN